MRLIYISSAWILGIFSQFYLDSTLPLIEIGLLFFVLFIILQMTHYSTIAFICLILAFFSLGAYRFSYTQSQSDDLVELHNAGTVWLDGVIAAEPDNRDTRLLVRFKVNQVQWLGHWEDRHGTVLLRLPLNYPAAYGDRLIVEGILRPAPVIDTFDYETYLARQGIYSQMSANDTAIEYIDGNHGPLWRRFQIRLKQKAERAILHALPEPEASLLTGILLGDDKGLSPTVREAFNITSTSHIIAISGFNMTLIASIVGQMFKIFIANKWRVFWLSAAVVGFYTLLVGTNDAVVRASIMSLVLIYGRNMRRQAYIPTSLAATVLLMTLVDPWTLWDIGFQLSFAAVLGIMVFVPPWEAWFQRQFAAKLGETSRQVLTRLISEPLIVGLSAQAFVLPFILFYFGRLSLISPLANLLIVPAQAGVLTIGGLGVLSALILPPLAQLFFQAVWIPLAWTTFSVQQLAQTPYASIAFPITAWIFSAAVGVMLSAVWVRATQPRIFTTVIKSRAVWSYFITIVVSLALFSTLLQRIQQTPSGQLEVIYLDAGLSNSVLIDSPTGAAFLIDGGRYPSRLLNTLGAQLSPRQRTIEVLFITSDEFDDIGALPTLIERYHVATVITAVNNSREQAYVDLIAQMQASGTIIQQAIHANQILTDDGLRFEVLAPHSAKDVGENMVLRLTYGEAVFLFTNRLSAPEENWLLNEQHLVQATVLQLAEHGQSNSNNARWLQVANPQVAILQNDPSHFEAEVAYEVLQRLEHVSLWRTDHHGEIHIRTDGTKLWIQTPYSD